MEVYERVTIRKPEIEGMLLEELITTATDRIKLRVEEDELPSQLESIAVEVVCAMYNRSHHEGVKNEQVDTFNISFVEDILSEYEGDFNRYLEAKKKKENENRGRVRFI